MVVFLQLSSQDYLKLPIFEACLVFKQQRIALQ